MVGDSCFKGSVKKKKKTTAKAHIQYITLWGSWACVLNNTARIIFKIEIDILLMRGRDSGWGTADY